MPGDPPQLALRPEPEPVQIDHHLRLPVGPLDAPERSLVVTLAELESAIAAARRIGVPDGARVMADRAPITGLHFDWSTADGVARRPGLLARLRGAR